MHLSRLTLSWEDEICIVSSYSVLLLLTLSILLLLKCVADLIIPALFSIIPKLFRNNSTITSAIKIPKLFPHNSCKPSVLVQIVC